MFRKTKRIGLFEFNHFGVPHQQQQHKKQRFIYSLFGKNKLNIDLPQHNIIIDINSTRKEQLFIERAGGRERKRDRSRERWVLLLFKKSVKKLVKFTFQTLHTYLFFFFFKFHARERRVRRVYATNYFNTTTSFIFIEKISSFSLNFLQ